MYKFKIGDKVYFNGKFPVIGADPYDVGEVTGFIKIYNGDVFYTVRFYNRRMTSINMSEHLLEIYDPIKEKERKDKQKLAKQLHKDDDPFGEEIWEGIKKFKDFKSGLSGI